MAEEKEYTAKRTFYGREGRTEKGEPFQPSTVARARDLVGAGYIEEAGAKEQEVKDEPKEKAVANDEANVKGTEEEKAKKGHANKAAGPAQNKGTSRGRKKT